MNTIAIAETSIEDNTVVMRKIENIVLPRSVVLPQPKKPKLIADNNTNLNTSIDSHVPSVLPTIATGFTVISSSLQIIDSLPSGCFNSQTAISNIQNTHNSSNILSPTTISSTSICQNIVENLQTHNKQTDNKTIKGRKIHKRESQSPLIPSSTSRNIKEQTNSHTYRNGKISHKRKTPKPTQTANIDNNVCFDSYQLFNEELTRLEVETKTGYLYRNRFHGFEEDTTILDYLKTINDSKQIKIAWQWERDLLTTLKFSGVPFIFLNSRAYTCHQGPNLSKKNNNRRRPVPQRSRRPSKKADCKVRFNVLKFFFFYGYEQIAAPKRSAMDKISSDIKNKLIALHAVISSGDPLPPSSHINATLSYITNFPDASEHLPFHALAPVNCIIEKLNPSVRDHVIELVKGGVTRRANITKRTMHFIENDADDDTDDEDRFYPKPKLINNVIASVRAEERRSKFDQENLVELIKKYGKIDFKPISISPSIEELVESIEAGPDFEYIEDIRYVLTSDVNSKLCFVYQSKNMQRLYNRYAPFLVILDVTHKACHYLLPFYSLVVQTNVNYQVVAVLVLEDESIDLLTRALNIVKSWNPMIKPKYGIIDANQAETFALELVYPETLVFLCDCHLEEAWMRWITKRNNLIIHLTDDIICRFRRIADSTSEDECGNAVNSLKAWEKYETKFETYFGKYWEPMLHKWVKAFQPVDLLNYDVSVGLETIHEELAFKYMDKLHDMPLSELMSQIINKFLPDHYKQYSESNMMYNMSSSSSDSSESAANSNQTQGFMLNRPVPLVQDMIGKWNSVTLLMLESVQPLCVISPQSKSFFVSDDSGSSSIDKIYLCEKESNGRTWHLVDFGNAMTFCSCECRCFRHSRFLCKHFMAVLMSGKGKWEEISPLYRNHPCMSIDNLKTNIKLEQVPELCDDDNGDNDDEEMEMENDIAGSETENIYEIEIEKNAGSETENNYEIEIENDVAIAPMVQSEGSDLAVSSTIVQSDHVKEKIDELLSKVKIFQERLRLVHSDDRLEELNEDFDWTMNTLDEILKYQNHQSW